MLDENKKKDFLAKFGKRLGEIKKTKGLTYRKIAANCDLDSSYISKIEKGTENITLETLLNLAYGLEIEPKELFDFEVKTEVDDIRK